jgi:hypothetical protein
MFKRMNFKSLGNKHYKKYSDVPVLSVYNTWTPQISKRKKEIEKILPILQDTFPYFHISTTVW